MSRLGTLSALALAASLSLLTLPALAEDANPTPRATAPVCSSRSVDNTSPEMKAFLAGARSTRAIGTPTMRLTSAAHVSTQEFEIIDVNGKATSVSVTCAASGCISGCATTGCNPTTINGQPACTSLTCVNSSGFPCATQGTCSKTVSQTGSSATPASDNNN